jgi:hypothetical protein
MLGMISFRSFLLILVLELMEIRVNSVLQKMSEKRYPSLNPCHSLRKPEKIFQDLESQESYQVLFRMLFQILLILVNMIFQG